MRYFIGFFLFIAGAAIVVKTEWFVQNFGASEWAEAKMGSSGGTRLLYKLIGLVMIFVGLLAITNLYGGFLMATVGRLFFR